MGGIALRLINQSRVALHGFSHQKASGLRHLASSAHSNFVSSQKFTQGFVEPGLVDIRLIGQTVTTVAKDVTVPGGARGTFSLWDLYTGQLLGTGGQGTTQPVTSFAQRWSNIAITGGNYCGIWPTSISSVARKYLFAHDAPVNCVDLGKKFCVTGTDAATCYLYDLATGQLQNVLRGHSKKITALAIDGKRIVSASADTTCRVWHHYNDKAEYVLRHSNELSCIALKGRVLATGTKDGPCKVWNAETGQSLVDLVGHKDNVTAIHIDEEEPIVFTSSADGATKVWDLIQGQCLATCEGHAAKINCLQQDGPLLATGSDDRTSKIWEKRTGKLLVDMEEDAAVTSLQLRGTTLVTGMANGTWRHTELPESVQKS